MKSVINEVKKEDKGITYPCIMKGNDSGVIVLFSSARVGVVLDPGNSEYYHGWHSRSWIDFNFEPLEGSVTLSND